MSEADPRRNVRRGSLLSLTSAVLFGVSAPLIKLLLPSASPLVVAGLLYLGAGLVLALPLAMGVRLRTPREALLVRDDLPTLAGVVGLGGIAGPVLLLVGLERVSGVAGSLLLNLEAPLTILVAVLLFGEHVGRRGMAALGLVLLGAVLLGARGGDVRVDPLGLLAIAAACLCWAFDNNLTQRLSGKDPIALTRVKCLAAGATNLALGLAVGGTLPTPWMLGATVLVGIASYGLSLVLATLALRAIGAARHAVHFSTAPFVGALASIPILGEVPRWVDLVGMTVMAFGIAVLLREQHRHPHAHDELAHDHKHRHDEHHRHDHPPGLAPDEPHAHPHRHERLVHDHAHASDLHHRHAHAHGGDSGA